MRFSMFRQQLLDIILSDTCTFDSIVYSQMLDQHSSD